MIPKAMNVFFEIKRPCEIALEDFRTKQKLHGGKYLKGERAKTIIMYIVSGGWWIGDDPRVRAIEQNGGVGYDGPDLKLD